jgi:hypothetical protein
MEEVVMKLATAARCVCVAPLIQTVVQVIDISATTSSGTRVLFSADCVKSCAAETVHCCLCKSYDH